MTSPLTLSTLPKTDTDMIAIKEAASRPTGGLRLKGSKSNADKVDSVASEFEAQFISQMLSNMFSTVDTKEALGGSDSEEVYNSLLIDEYGKILARSGGVGVADQVKRIMINQQEVK
jgi:peptidoglycan hydrolase FlgJ